MPDEDARLTDFLPDEEGETPTREEPTPEEESMPDEERPTPDDAAQPDETEPTPDDAAQPDETEPTPDDPAPDPGTVAPAVPTATWRPGASCEACGAAVERRWRDGDALVCADCKEW